MRRFIGKAIIITSLLICAVVFLGYKYAMRNLRSFVSSFSKESFDAEVSIDHIGFGFPLFLELRNVEIGDSFEVRSVQVYPNPASFLLRDKVIVSVVRLVDPVLRIKAEKDRQPGIPDFLKRKTARETSTSSSPSLPRFYFSRVEVQNGILMYDGNEGSSLEFVKLGGVAESPGLYFSKDSAFQFFLTGFFKNKKSDFLSPLEVKGRVAADNTVKARLRLSDVKLKGLEPLYSRYLSHVAEEGAIDLKSNIRISKRDLMADCALKGKDIVLKEGLAQNIDVPLVAGFILFFNFRNRVVKLKNIRGNFLNIIPGQR